MATRSFTTDRVSPTEAGLSIEIKNIRPVELADLTKSFSSFAEEFRRHIELREPEASAAEVKLYVKEIRTGSIIADLVAVSPQLLQGVSYLNAVVTFSKNLKTAYDYLTGKSDETPDLDKTSYENLANIVEPVAKDRGSQLNIGTINAPVVINMNSTDANAAQNSARRHIEKLKAPESRLHEKVLLYWYQARGDAKSKAGDRGIIESISKRPVKVIFATDSIKLSMVLEEENPFKEAYIVDVMVETIGDKPAMYKILAVHDKMNREDL